MRPRAVKPDSLGLRHPYAIGHMASALSRAPNSRRVSSATARPFHCTCPAIRRMGGPKRQDAVLLLERGLAGAVELHSRKRAAVVGLEP